MRKLMKKLIINDITRAGNEPSYSGSARKKLGSGSARELNEPSLSFNLSLINLGLGSGSARKKLGSGRRDPSIVGTRLLPMVSDRQDLVFTGAIPTQSRRSEMPKSCVPDIDVMDPQALDPVNMDGKCVNPHEAVKEALTTRTAGARANPTPSAGGIVPRSLDLLGSGNGTHDSAKVSATVCSSVDSVKKVPVKGTSGKDMDVGYDPLVRSVDPGVQESYYKYEGTGLNSAHLGVGMGKGIKGDHGVGFHRGNKEPTSGTARTDGVTPGVPPSAAGYENLGRFNYIS